MKKKEAMIRRPLSVLLSILMVMSVFTFAVPFTAFADDTHSVSFDVCHNDIGVNVCRLPTDSVSVDGITYTYDPATEIMTFNGSESTSPVMFYAPFYVNEGYYRVTTTYVGGSKSGTGQPVIEPCNSEPNWLYDNGNRMWIDATQGTNTTVWYFNSTNASACARLECWIWSSGTLTLNNYQIKLKIERIASSTAAGTEYSPCQRTVGSTYGILPVPKFSGYQFEGWYTDTAFTNKVTYSSAVSGDTTLYAKWNNLITFDSNYDSIRPNLYIPYGSSVTSSGLTYSYDYETGIMTFNGTASGSPTLFYAPFTPTEGTYKVTSYNVGGSKSGTGQPVFEPCSGDTSWMYTDYPTNSNRMWLDATAGTYISTWTFDAHNAGLCTQIQCWAWNGGSLVFDNYQIKLKIEKVNSSSDNITAFSPCAKAVDSLYGTLPRPTRDGYIFDGWFTDTAFTNEVTSASTVSGHALSAKWVYPVDYDVNHDSIGVNVFSPETSTISSHGITYTYDASTETMCFNGSESETPTMFYVPFTVSAGTYKVTSYYVSGSKTGTGQPVFEPCSSAPAWLYNNGTDRLWIDCTPNTAVKQWVFSDANAAACTYMECWIWSPSGSTLTFDNYKLKFKVEKVSSYDGTASVYSPARGLAVGTYGTLPTVTRDHYSQSGWYTEAACSNKVTTSATAAAHTLYAGWDMDTYPVIFENRDGSVIKTETVAWGGSATAPADPTTPADAHYTYTFTGWDKTFDNITGPTVVTAVYSQTVNSYTVTFKNWDGSVFDTQTADYGTDSVLPSSAPTRPYDDTNHYTFNSWSDTYKNIVKNTDVMANYTAEAHSCSYEITTAPTADAAGLLTGTCTCGKTVTVNVPSLDSTDYTLTVTDATPDAAGNTHYVWKSNDTYGVNVTGDIAIPALGYTVSFYKEDGTTLIQAQHADTLADAVAAYDGDLQTKDATAQYTYHFDKWVTSAIDEAAGTYKAVPTFTSTVNKYDVKFFNYDGVQIGDTQSIEYGSDATAPADPTKPYDNNAHYTFNGWTGYTNITAATDITAAFTAVPHSYTYAVTTAPTKTTAGLLTGTCICGKTVTVNIPALNDTDYTVTTTAATPDAAGNTHYVWNDNDTYSINVKADIVIPALGYTVSFYQEDGTTLIQTQHADTLADAVAAYDGALPTKDATAQYTYTFDKWTTSAADEAAGTYKAVPTFTSTVNKYTVTFKNYDGTVIDTQSVEYGKDATAPADPTKSSDDTDHYTFDGWTGYTNITKNTDITATFTTAAHSYTYAVTTEPTKTAAGLLTGTCACGHTVTADLPVLSDTDYDLVTVPATTDAAGSETYTWKSNADYGVNVTVVIVIPKTGFTVSFYDESGVTLLDTQTAGSLDDAIAAYSGAAQTKAETAQYSYTFAGWTTTATDVNNGLYKAVAKFDETTRKYTVTFKNDDGTVLDTQSVAYGSGAAAPAEPTKAATAQYSYTFAGWDKTCDNITSDLTVTATYSQTVNTYTVTYYNNDGTVLYTAQVPYGSSVTYAGSAPAYVGEYAKDMEFVGWSVTTDSITGVTSVKAVYKDTGSKLSRFFDKLIDFIIKIRDILLRITEAHGNTYDVNIWTGGKWQ